MISLLNAAYQRALYHSFVRKPMTVFSSDPKAEAKPHHNFDRQVVRE
jgi:hypothetical protein